jgi:spermidine synthase
MIPPVVSVALLLFGSGLCALVYQVAWLRELRLVFGASTAASAAVLAVFMGGLGLGGALLGKRAGTRARPLAFYAQLEYGVALAAAVSPLVIGVARAGYAALGGTLGLGLAGGTVVRLVFSALILGVPTFLMGGTLPAAAQAVETDRDVGRRNLALLYGANTLGAVLGTVVSTFALLEILGTRRMLWGACLVNALVATFARALSRRLGESEPAAPATPAAPSDGDGGADRLLLWAAALVGFAFLLMELVWYRMLGPLLGGSSFTFGLILAVALAGIGAGGVAYAWFGGRARPSLGGFALTCGLEALGIAVPFALGDRLAVLTAILQPLGSIGFFGLVMGWTVVTSMVVLPAAFVAGVQFPLLIALVGEGRRDVGRQVGQIYASNTLGAIVGSLAGGFGLLPLVGAPNAWRVVFLLLAAFGAVLALRASPSPSSARRSARAALAVALGTIALTATRGPTAAWRHSSIGVGRAPTSGTPNSWIDWAHGVRRSIVWDRDGRESSVALESGQGYAFVVNGKVDGHVRSDGPTQVMGGLLGAILHGDVKRAMVVGLGTGSTAGWLGALPAVETVDVAELEPAIVDVARAAAPVNRDVLDNPKVHLFLGDAREMMLTSRARYDLVFSEPSNPYRAGIASLFTQEFYRAVEARLADGGMLVQWVQTYNVDAQTIRTIYATLASVFPAVETWLTEESDLMLVATRRPMVHDVPSLRARVAQEPYASALQHVFLADDLEGLLAHFVARPSLAAAIGKQEAEDLNTDDQTLVEFGFARAAGVRAKMFDLVDLRAVARERHEDRPMLGGAAIDWDKIVSRRISMLVSQGDGPSGAPSTLPEGARHLARAATRWIVDDRKGALAEWGGRVPEDPVERQLAADGLAEAGDETALPLIEELRATRPLEADVFRARLRLRQNRVDEATAALLTVFDGYRRDPWPMIFIMRGALALAVEIAGRDKAAGERLHEALAAPFVVSLLDEDRHEALLKIASAIDFPRLCARDLAWSEGAVPWRQQLLALRVRCYDAAGSELAGRAHRDLARFAAEEPLPFGAGLLAPQ